MIKIARNYSTTTKLHTIEFYTETQKSNMLVIGDSKNLKEYYNIFKEIIKK